LKISEKFKFMYQDERSSCKELFNFSSFFVVNPDRIARLKRKIDGLQVKEKRHENSKKMIILVNYFEDKH
jgi:hypothetical protein